MSEMPNLPLPPSVYNKRKSDAPSTVAGVIDTLESVIIALILALVFRAFIVEAFVIPTGSMAPTLLGAHFDVICTQCGYAYKENAGLNVQLAPNGKLGVTGQRGELVSSRTIPAPNERYCPNCGNGINAMEFPGHPEDRVLPDGRGRVVFPWASNGDRILVLKYLYSLLEPQRWDVIVFKEPMHGQDNYIKRLLGLPGEELQIVDGDVFVRKTGTTEPFQVARKPRYAQKALWQLVFDQDFYPLDAGKLRKSGVPFQNLWQGAGKNAEKWQIESPILRFQGGESGGKLAFTPRDWYLLNVRGYNSDLRPHEGQTLPNGDRQPRVHHVVNDTHLEFVWQPKDVKGASLAVIMGPAGNCYRLVWGDTLRLEKRSGERWLPVDKAQITPSIAPPQAGRWYQVEMNNVDHEVQVYLDDRLAVHHAVTWTAEDAMEGSREIERIADRTAEYPEISLEVGGECEIGHLKLMRDVYYTQESVQNRAAVSIVAQDPGINEMLRTQEMTRASAGHPVTILPDEFFAMGDNSTASFDSRGWDKIHPSLEGLVSGGGVVPRRFMLGRAFFVYWPAGFRPMNGASDRFRPLDVPLVPNVGEMRFIR